LVVRSFGTAVNIVTVDAHSDAGPFQGDFPGESVLSTNHASRDEIFTLVEKKYYMTRVFSAAVGTNLVFCTKSCWWNRGINFGYH
jgi:hypothetical protein